MIPLATKKINMDEENSSKNLSASAQESLNFNFNKRDFSQVKGGTARRQDYAKTLNRVILRDMNNNPNSPTFNKYTKAQIKEYLQDPFQNEVSIRDSVIYAYGAYSRFWRIIQYFAGLTDLSYYISTNNIDTTKTKPDKMKKNWLKTISFVDSMNIKTQGRDILVVCLREDVYYATCWVYNDTVTIQQLPSEYCTIASIEGNVSNVNFDFSYFDRNAKYLPLYPAEFTTKYNAYKRDRKLRYQDLDSPTSFAIKVNDDIKNYPLPPMAGVLASIYDLADYQDLKLTQTELENYALLVMRLGMTDGHWDMDFNKAKEFWSNLSGVLPSQIGSVLTPMPIEKIDFNKSGATDVDKVAEAESTVFSEAGVSSLLFNNDKASANALALSIKADQAITFSIVKSIEDALNRLLHSQSFGKDFKINFIDCSPFNRKEMADQYLKAATYGMPTISAYCATVGLNPDDAEGLSYLENEVLGLVGRFKPLQSSNTMSTSPTDSEGEAGRPVGEVGEITDEGEKTQEKQ